MSFPIDNNFNPKFKTVDGNFYAGMKLDDAENNGAKSRIKFRLIDKSNDEVISAEEIIDRRKNEIRGLQCSLSGMEEQCLRLKNSDSAALYADKIAELEDKIEKLEQKILEEETITQLYEEELANGKEKSSKEIESFEGWG